MKQFIQEFRAIPGIIKKLWSLPGAIVDPNGLWFINLMFDNANVPNKYRYMFFPDYDDAIFLDCWMNVWLITDIALKQNMEVYWFEPNPVAIKLLNKKYLWNKKVHIYPYAVSNENSEMNFYSNPQSLFDQWGSIIKEFAENEGGERLNNPIQVQVKKLTNIIKHDILTRHKYIHLLKLDIEWAEFWIIDDIIKEGLYENITYIVVETHERFFTNWNQMLKDLKNKIKDNNIKNIYLDWI